MRVESLEREWARQAVKAATSEAAAAAAAASNGAPQPRWLQIAIPPGVQPGESIMMDTSEGRFAVLVPTGLAAGAPLLVPVPAAPEPAAGAAAALAADGRHAARAAQLQELMGRGFAAHDAAPYCDGVSDVAALAELITSDAAALDAGDGDGDGDDGRRGRRGGGGGPSPVCAVS